MICAVRFTKTPRTHWRKRPSRAPGGSLLKNPENLDADKNEPQRLQEALQINQALAIAYYLKEALREFWYQP